jgi:hypothetical protein
VLFLWPCIDSAITDETWGTGISRERFSVTSTVGVPTVDGMDGLLRGLAVGLVTLAVVTGCGAGFPADPDGTLAKVNGGELRVGASVNPPHVTVQGQRLSGTEVSLVEGYAAARDAGVEWVQGGEEDLMNQLKHGELDLVIGGLTEKTPWTRKAGLTRPYAESVDEFGSRHKHVLAVPLGENAFLLDLDTYLQARKEG